MNKSTKVVLLILALFIIFQNNSKAQNDDRITKNELLADSIVDDSAKRGSSARVLYWYKSLYRDNNDNYHCSIKTPISFTSFGIGWQADTKDIPAGHFKIFFRLKKEGEEWTSLYEDEGYIHPTETPREMYFTDLLFPPTEEAYDYIEFYIRTPRNVNLQKVRLDIIDIRETGKPGPSPGDEDSSYEDKRACPEFPAIIPRSEWCGVYTACHNPTYTPKYITPTHTVMHHGASPDTYTDGYAVVRSYWNYHVNTLGWADIGYNYLFDKYGNFFLGRYNPNLPTSDVRSAHAGASNGASIGINFLGNSDVTLPTQEQLDKNNQMLAWWYDYRGLDPTSSATITLQSGGSGTVPRICGHKDVNIGGTDCPGDALYTELPGIRTNTKTIIDNCYEPNCEPPLTSISSPPEEEWINNDFTAIFDDTDSGCGISRRFYQVLEYDGNNWRANTNNGFFGDNFDVLNNEIWTISTGDWNISNANLIQSNEAISNTNIYAPLNQTLSNSYLYQFYAKVEGSGTNKRFGFHFFSDDGSLSERGNSYFIWFRVDGQSLQFYKVTDNTFSLVETVSDVITTAGQWYDFKIVYDRITGEILVYRDDILLGSWTDPAPYSTNGDYISFRTGNCQMHINELKVYRTRYPEATITVGEENSNDIRTQNTDINTPAGKIKSIIADDYENLSVIAHHNLNIDRTPPQDIPYVNDGISEDIDETNSGTELSANWGESYDVNSGITAYWYAIGSEPGTSDIADWTNNGLNTSVTHSGLNLTSGETYFYTVKAENTAGLFSNTSGSNGQTVITGPYNLQHTLQGCPDNNVTFAWSNSGSGWYIQVSEHPDFSSPYWKWVSGLTSYTGPEGFESQNDGSPLIFIGGTTYYWRIYGGDSFTNSLSFTLPICDCMPIQEFPYSENFDNGESLCWEIEQTSSTTWETATSLVITDYTIEPVSGTHFYRCPWTNTESQDEWLISPVFDFSTLTRPEISFWFFGSYHWSIEQENCNLDLLVRENDGPWELIWNNADHPDFISNDINWIWLQTYIELIGFENKQNVQFAFRYTGLDGANFGVDDIKIRNYILAGDVNNDNMLNVLDVVWMVRHIAGDTPDGFNHEAADVTETGGEVTTADLTQLIDLIMNGAKKQKYKANHNLRPTIK